MFNRLLFMIKVAELQAFMKLLTSKANAATDDTDTAKQALDDCSKNATSTCTAQEFKVEQANDVAATVAGLKAKIETEKIKQAELVASAQKKADAATDAPSPTVAAAKDDSSSGTIIIVVVIVIILVVALLVVVVVMMMRKGSDEAASRAYMSNPAYEANRPAGFGGSNAAIGNSDSNFAIGKADSLRRQGSMC